MFSLSIIQDKPGSVPRLWIDLLYVPTLNSRFKGNPSALDASATTNLWVFLRYVSPIGSPKYYVTYSNSLSYNVGFGDDGFEVEGEGVGLMGSRLELSHLQGFILIPRMAENTKKQWWVLKSRGVCVALIISKYLRVEQILDLHNFTLVRKNLGLRVSMGHMST